MKPRADSSFFDGRLAVQPREINTGTPWQSITSGRPSNWTPAREEAAAAQARAKAERAGHQPAVPRADLDILIPTEPTAAGDLAIPLQPQVVRVWVPQSTAAH
jgi:hypothetical protein